ncbi:hypothetical protein Pla22_41720 [Rubripirellula amarantea]|uniref:Uncharacterized protein n=1 Tax=Rubripirellula amarantea TaxID=2527999 RepID=A0A5C5WKT8_9BACT|nr:hypothetical protein [Rubripirellula amarantea]TWT51394.1 hypothetical protein Pla22_41720 [Rubripirellula amarantea]
MQTDKTESSRRRRQHLNRQRVDRRLLMGSAERLIEFLERCVSRGVGSGNEALPTLRELSKLCECEASTLSRIRSGDTTSTDRFLLEKLHALGGILPSPPPKLIDEEIVERLHDARIWYDQERFDGELLMNALKVGIRERNRLRRSRVRSRKQTGSRV